MKSNILSVAIAALFLTAGSYLLSCNSPEQKVEDAREDVVDAQQNLNEANADYQAELENYRRDVAARSESNTRTLDEFKARVNEKRADARAEYNRKIDDLEQRNREMKTKVDDYRANGRDNWEEFKREVDHDMEELGNAIRDLGNDNAK